MSARAFRYVVGELRANAVSAFLTLLGIVLVISSAGSLLFAAGAEQALDNRVQPDWWARARQHIEDSEYHLTWQEQTQLLRSEAAWQAPNRAQNFRAYFTDAGVRLFPRLSQEPSWDWGLDLVACGRAGALRPVDAARLWADSNRIEYARGDILEWYVNDRRGLEQGFTLLEQPAATGKVVLLFRLSGSLSARIADDGQAVDFLTPSGAAALRYSGLLVSDAGGEVLEARLEGGLEGGLPALRLVVDDSGARYPLTIDPLLTSPSWTAEGNQTDAEFGAAAATAGDVNGDGFSDVIVGAHLFDNGQTDEGRAFVFHGSASGLSTTPAWQVESNQAGSEFAFTVSGAGDVNDDGFADVIVGAHLFDNGQLNEGAVFGYHGSASGLSLTPSWSVESNQAGVVSPDFGISISGAGDVNGDGFSDVIVGAQRDENGQASEGRAFVYHGSASGLSTTPGSAIDGNQVNAFFGHAVGAAGDVNGDGFADVIVGAWFFDNGQVDEGRAFVHHGSASGIATSASWTTESNRTNAFYGNSVAGAGDVNGDGFADVIVGASRLSNGETEEGGAFVYHGSASGLSTSAALSLEGNQAGAEFGSSVAGAGDVDGDGYADVIVGARLLDNGEADEGHARLYSGSQAGVFAFAVWTADGDQASAHFGVAVATAGDVNGDGFSDVIVGASGFANGHAGEGRASVYHGSSSTLSFQTNWQIESEQAQAELGWSVATAGDVNGDGFADVIVGAPQFDNGHADEGRALVFAGSSAGLLSFPSWTAESDQAGARLGHAVAGAGDVNGDGYADVVVGANLYDNGATDEGSVFAYHGSPAGLSTSAAWTAESDQAGARLGSSVGAAGDVNGDGFSDVIAGAPSFDNGELDEGRSLVFHGATSGLSATANWTAESNQAGAEFGGAVGTAGDVNGDRYSDVIVGARLFDNGQTDEGRAFVYRGGNSGVSASPVWTQEGQQATAEYGASVGTAGDVNGDGFAEVIVGAPAFDNGEADEGRAAVYHGSAGGLSSVAGWIAEADQAGARFGSSAGLAGDVNGDGFADVVVAAPLYDSGEVDEGRVFVHHGSPLGLATVASWTAESGLTGAQLGSSAATAGDTNGDGYADVILGAAFYVGGVVGQEAGAVIAHYGNGAGLSLVPQQRRSDDSAPIAHLGRSDCLTCFRLGALGRTPYGRGRVMPQWEVKPYGTPFNGAGVQSSGVWLDTGTAGAPISQPLTALAPATSYHWRLRLAYDPVTTPQQPASRWFTMPADGWQQADLKTAGCRDDDGDGLGAYGDPACPGGAQQDCNDANPNCSTNCTDADGDGYCVTTDCNEANPNCTSNCTDADADGFCVTTDCDETRPACNTDCTNADGDALAACAGDCNDANPNCLTNCTDADSDGYCITTDCNEANPNCTSNCTDADSDGYCVTADCNEANPNCTSNCTDADADGYCVTTDCNDANAQANPGFVELCMDGADNDCDTFTDLGDSQCAALVVTGLRFTNDTVLTWNAAPGATAYALYRGAMSDAAFSYNHLCEASEIAGISAEDEDAPLPGEGFYYLATGLTIAPGPNGSIIGGPLGTRSNGNLRPESGTISCGPRVYLDPDAIASSGSGLSWANAYTSFSFALLHQRARHRGLELWISGTVNNPGATISGTFRPGMRLLGGFAGTESASWDRSPSLNPTLLLGANLFATPLLRAIRADLVLDGLTLRNGDIGVVSTSAGDLLELTDVTLDQILNLALDLTVEQAPGGELFVTRSSMRHARAVSQAGALTGRIRNSSIQGGAQAALRLEARPQGVNAEVRVDVLANIVAGGSQGVVLGAHVNNQAVTASQTSFLGSNVIHGATGDALVVEASGAFSSTSAPASALALPVIVGNTLSDTGGAGLFSSASRTDSSGSESVHVVRAAPQAWDNLITFNGQWGIEESSDNPATNLIADPVVVGNDLFGNDDTYFDEGFTALHGPAAVNGLAGNSDNYASDPLYLNRPADDYHILPESTPVKFLSAMQYRVNTQDPLISPALDWTTLGYVVDGNWLNGSYGVGYEDFPPGAQALIATPVTSQSRSVYTRATFNVSDVTQVRTILLGVDYDDGYVAWINGFEVARQSMQPGPPAWDTTSGLHESSNGTVPVYETVDISALAIPQLQNGTNVLAIGIWNGPMPSSDLVLVPQLVINLNPSIDAGHTNAPRLARQDLDGQNRVRDANGDGSPKPDTGADEK